MPKKIILNLIKVNPELREYVAQRINEIIHFWSFSKHEFDGDSIIVVEESLDEKIEISKYFTEEFISKWERYGVYVTQANVC